MTAAFLQCTQGSSVSSAWDVLGCGECTTCAVVVATSSSNINFPQRQGIQYRHFCWAKALLPATRTGTVQTCRLYEASYIKTGVNVPGLLEYTATRHTGNKVLCRMLNQQWQISLTNTSLEFQIPYLLEGDKRWDFRTNASEMHNATLVVGFK